MREPNTICVCSPTKGALVNDFPCLYRARVAGRVGYRLTQWRGREREGEIAEGERKRGREGGEGEKEERKRGRERREGERERKKRGREGGEEEREGDKEER